LVLLLATSIALAETEASEEKTYIFAIVKDEEGETLEGYLRFQPQEITVTSRDDKEKAIPSKYIKSITLERIKEEGPGTDPKQEAKYSVKVENSQEIYTLKKKYTFSLNTSVGIVTKTIDPEMINSILYKDSSPGAKFDKDFVQDKSVVFSLELKF
jgi:hypothetical protein